MSCAKGKHTERKATRFGFMCTSCRHTLVCADGHEFATSPLPDTIACIHCGFEIDVKYQTGADLGKFDKAVDDETDRTMAQLKNRKAKS